jgi:ribose transport system permease protein
MKLNKIFCISYLDLKLEQILKNKFLVLKRSISFNGKHPKLKNGSVSRFIREYAVLVPLMMLFIILSFSSESFFSTTNILNILNQQTPLAIIAIAGTFVIISGGFDLSTGAIFAVANVVAAWITVNLSSPYLGLMAAPVVGLLLGVVNGVVVTRLKIHSFLATLATSLVYRALAVLVTGGALIPISDPQFSVLGREKFLGVFWAVWLLLVFLLISSFISNKTVFGRYISAIGGNSEAAELSGITVDRIRILVFGFSGLAAGLASSIALSRVASGQPLAGSGLELDAIAAIILGGTSIYGGVGAIWRSICGVYLIALIGNGFNLLNMNPLFKDLVTGAVILIAVAVAASERKGR